MENIIIKVIRGWKYLVLVAIAGLYGLSGIVVTEPGERTLQIKMLGADRGISPEVLKTGTWWVEPFKWDVATYDSKYKQKNFPSVPGQTKDGQKIHIDLSLFVGLIDDKIPTLHEEVGKNWEEEMMRPALRKILREASSGVDSDRVYTQEGRIYIADYITKTLPQMASKLGINVSEINLRDIRFLNDEFTAALDAKAKEAQNVIIAQRQALRALENAKKLQNQAEGEKWKRIEAAEANKLELIAQGEGKRIEQEEIAKGILAVGLAEAEVREAKRRALAGPGGKELVALAWANNLGPNVKVWGVPTGSPGTSNLMDLNGLLNGAFAPNMKTGK